eukprot:5364150-Prymnesium_polylepis.1
MTAPRTRGQMKPLKFSAGRRFLRMSTFAVSGNPQHARRSYRAYPPPCPWGILLGSARPYHQCVTPIWRAFWPCWRWPRSM